jgi:hypothetical protein
MRAAIAFLCCNQTSLTLTLVLMKKFFLKCLLALVFIAACITVVAQPNGVEGNCTPKQKSELAAAAKNFFDWYRQQYPAIKQLALVAKTGKGGSYRVQWNAADTFLARLQSSGLFNHEFIATWKDFFKARDQHFKEHPQTKGEPLGFEYDLVLLTKTPRQTLDKAKNIKIQFINFTEGAYLVEAEVKDWYMIYFKKEGNKWKICDVTNGSED